MDILRALKAHFDPHGIMNPGGTIGLDLPEKEKRYLAPQVVSRRGSQGRYKKDLRFSEVFFIAPQ